MASSFEESDSDTLLSEEHWIVSSAKRKHIPLLQSDSLQLGAVSVVAGESTSSHVRPTDSYPNGNAIRSRLLNKLGFELAVPQKPNMFIASPLPSLHENNAFFVDLKGDYGVADKNRLQDQTVNAKRRIVFNPEVKVQSIPSHTEFSDRIRRVLWTDAVEMDENAARNCLEYTAEGWDWRNVLVDEDMIVINGEKIHPVHFADYEFSVNRELSSVASQIQ